MEMLTKNVLKIDVVKKEKLKYVKMQLLLILKGYRYKKPISN